MRGLYFEDKLTLRHDLPEPEPRAGEALIKLRMAGICHTDLELTRGYMGFTGVLGHEFVGETLADYGSFAAGTRVVGEINVACGICDLCLANMPSQCRNRVTLGIDRYDGVFAERFRLPVRNLYAVPESIDDEAAVFVEPLAAALQIPELVPITPSQRVILIGAGKLGLLAAQVLRNLGCELVVVARRQRPIQLLEKWHIAYVDARRADWLDRIGRKSAHVVVDCTGNAEGFAQALEIVRPRGTIVLKSTYSGLPHADLTRVVVDEIKVIGSRCGPFGAAIRLLGSQQIDVASMIEAIYPLEDSLAAFEHASSSGVLKVLLRP
ncbi:MAG: alcohol dehydrogenase [Candidatus Thermofonsia Clade 1 bacterium]|uniref:Alcohol dehydrogenase n=1 Tax=Candidatus Thermofonsia Clade 1 bacterium TaxID=2364210 RepID=A0A2M8PHC1_9CHLR|nr:MAG: alcohol dehydrogenase [Candidatus Thermofonsia Clade 1 bacterium]PJF42511.1 MAG: alcohol dehydrogenase [Candidatus Thermofonsia Clade 1 bacterium]RMF49554.1 MAG: alcohol dehydrogenase [Chloroflexota bacterium]